MINYNNYNHSLYVITIICYNIITITCYNYNNYYSPWILYYKSNYYYNNYYSIICYDYNIGNSWSVLIIL